MIPESCELTEPVVSWFNSIAGERGVERVDPAFEFLYPAFDAIPGAMNENAVTDTEPAEGRSVFSCSVGNYHLRQLAEDDGFLVGASTGMNVAAAKQVATIPDSSI